MGRVSADLRAWAEPWRTGEYASFENLERTNLSLNPRAAVDLFNITGNSLVSLDRVVLGESGHPAPDPDMPPELTTGIHAVGNADADSVMRTLNVVAGRTYHFSQWVRLKTLTATGVRLAIFAPGSVPKGTPSSTLATLDDWTRLEAFVTADADAAWTFRTRQLGAGAADWYQTGTLIEEASSAGVYFDGGSFPRQTRFQGVEHASVSELYTAGDALLDYLEAIGSMYEELEELAFDAEEGDPVFDEDYEGWTILLDVDRAPARVLPYLAQYVGEKLPTGLEITNEAAAREWIKDAPNSRRGTIESMVRTAQRTLTGQRTVVIHERTPDEDTVTVHTLAGETPNADLVEAALRADAVPGDIVLVYSTIVGQTYNDLNVAVASYDEMNTEWPDYNAVASAVPAGTTYTRPPP